MFMFMQDEQVHWLSFGFFLTCEGFIALTFSNYEYSSRQPSGYLTVCLCVYSVSCYFF